MKINNIKNNTSFKWNRTTHLEMTMLALEDLNLDKVSKRQIARFSQMPDFQKSELGFYNNTHFFFPNSKKKSFGKDPNNLNAYSKFKEHIINILKSNDKENFLRALGYALHYLQDMSVPVHTEPGGIIQKIFKYRTHTKFEKDPIYGATSKLNILKKNYIPQKAEHNSFENLFQDTAEFSQRPEYKVTTFNKKRWLMIQQDCFNKGVNSSREFLEKILLINDKINL